MGSRVMGLLAGLSAWTGFLFVFARLLMDDGHRVSVSAGIHGVHGPSAGAQFWIWAMVGTGAQVGERLRALAAELEIEELVVITWTWDPAAQRRSYELLAQEFGLQGA